MLYSHKNLLHFRMFNISRLNPENKKFKQFFMRINKKKLIIHEKPKEISIYFSSCIKIKRLLSNGLIVIYYVLDNNSLYTH